LRGNIWQRANTDGDVASKTPNQGVLRHRQAASVGHWIPDIN
jgi:hypothetical protein